MSFDKICYVQFLVDVVFVGSGYFKKFINEEEVWYIYEQVGGLEKGWFVFQGYYEEMLEKIGGSFFKQMLGDYNCFRDKVI